MLARFRKISLYMAYTVATIPLWHYITDEKIILLMLVVIAFAYLNVVISSVDTAQLILSSEKAKTPLPRWLPKKPEYEKCWLIVRHTLKWHLFLVPAKMGLTLGFMEWLYSSNRFDFFPVRLFDRIYNYYGTTYTENPYPEWEAILIAALSITAYSMLETILNSAIITLASYQQTCFIKRTVWVLFLRFSIALSIVGSIVLLYTLNNHDSSYYRCTVYSPEDYPNMSPDCTMERITETFYISLITPFDQSIILSANIMRPISYTFTMNYESLAWDNRLFVLRQIVAAILGIFLYLATTGLILFFAEDQSEHHPTAS